MTGLVSTPRESELEAVPLAASRKAGPLEALSSAFPPQTDAGIWGFLPTFALLSQVEGLWSC